MTDQPAPLVRLAEDRARAAAAGDPWAKLCAVATVSASGEPELRTVVLRDVEHQLALFFNALSPKWSEQHHSRQLAIMIYLPSIEVQYRLRATTTLIPDAIVHASWRQRPQTARQLDWYYAQYVPQSRALQDRAQFLEVLEKTDPQTLTEAPPTAMGVYLAVSEVDRLELANDRPHRRVRYRQADGWQCQELVP